jgi:hypothetical protein
MISSLRIDKVATVSGVPCDDVGAWAGTADIMFQIGVGSDGTDNDATVATTHEHDIMLRPVDYGT